MQRIESVLRDRFCIAERIPALIRLHFPTPVFYFLKTVISALYSDHTRNGVKCYARTFCSAWFTPFLVWSKNPKSIMQNTLIKMKYNICLA